MKPSFRRLVVGALMAFALKAVHAASIAVDTAEVEQALQRGAVVWDARGADDYAQGHIPGAVNFGDAGDLFRDANREDPPSVAVAAQLFGQAGIDILNREVVVYTRTCDPFAYYAARMLECYGDKHGKVYHGGPDAWKAAGKPVSTAATTLPPVQLSLSTQGAGALWTKEVVERVKGGGVQSVDARTPKEYAGDEIRAIRIRGGHVVGAVNIPYEQNWQDPATAAKLGAKQVKTRDGMALKSQDRLKALYAKLDPAKETIVYCQSGVRASETVAVLRDAGFGNVKVYEPSWLGCAGALSAPVEGEVFVNVGALNGKIASLQGCVKSLEAGVEKTEARNR